MQHTTLTPADLEKGTLTGRIGRLEWYCLELHRQVMRRLANRADADDVAQRVVERLLQQPERIMADYPVPAQYAAAATRHTAIAEERRNRGQRGEGTRIHRGDDGSGRPRRQVLSGDAVGRDDETSLFDRQVDGADPIDELVAERLDLRAATAAAVTGLDAADRRAFHMVDVLGHPVTEVAEAFGVTRETMSRRMSRIRNTVRQNLDMVLRTPAVDA